MKLNNNLVYRLKIFENLDAVNRMYFKIQKYVNVKNFVFSYIYNYLYYNVHMKNFRVILKLFK